MKKNITFLFFLFSLSQVVSAQVSAEKWIKGQIAADAIALQGINVINTSSKINSISDQYGNFSIVAKEGDVLSFSAVDYEPLRKIVNRQEFKLGSIVVNMTPTSIELREVVVNVHPEISAENMGIIPRNQIKLSPAERKVYTATSTNTDALLNYFSGRTKMLKKEVVLEKKEVLRIKLESFFDNKYYIETLKIPEELIKGFQYYCVEDPEFVSSIQSKNKTMSMFLMANLASIYNKNRVFEK